MSPGQTHDRAGPRDAQRQKTPGETNRGNTSGWRRSLVSQSTILSEADAIHPQVFALDRHTYMHFLPLIF